MNLPTQTLYEIESLRRIMDGEGAYPTIEAREEAIDRLKYSIMEVVLTLLLGNSKKNTHR